MGTRVACPAPLARRAHRSFVGERLALTTCTRRQSQIQHWRLSSAARWNEVSARNEVTCADKEVTCVPGKVVPTTAASGSAPITSPVTAAAAPKALSQTDKFQPWFRQLEAELLAVALDLVRETTGARVDSGAEDVTEEEEEARADEERRMQRTLGQAGYEARRLGQLQQLGQRMGKLAQLLAHDVLPKFPQDPEALFLCASADFLTRKFDSALRAMQRSLLATPEGHCTARELAARHYFVALIAMRIATEAQDPQLKGDEAKPLRPTLPERRRVELEGIIERGLSECMRLDPRHHSAYVDSEMLAELRYPNDAHAKVRLFADMVRSACKTGRYWVHPLQRPMHFYPKLRSQPWWELSEFGWAATLIEHFDEIRREVVRMRQPAGAEARAERWDQVGRTHDAGDRELVEHGLWTELVLLNKDEKVAAMVARNRKMCPITAKLLDGIQCAADMARRGVGEATFSALGGGAHLKPHCGSTNCRLTAHLPLLVPEGGASIRCGDETRQYREGELMIFDDSYEHEVWQSGAPDSVRVVLLIRFWHPDIAPARYPEAFHHMRTLHTKHRRRLLVPPLRKYEPL